MLLATKSPRFVVHNADATVLEDWSWSMGQYDENTGSSETRQVLAFGERANPIISFIENMTDDDAAVVDELSNVDEEPELANRTA